MSVVSCSKCGTVSPDSRVPLGKLVCPTCRTVGNWQAVRSTLESFEVQVRDAVRLAINSGVETEAVAAVLTKAREEILPTAEKDVNT